MTVSIYTDGSSRGNPGPGGYGVILMSGTHQKELSQGFRYTTNNRMELMAVIGALKAVKKKGINITIHSDSQYVVNAIEKGWLKKWISTNFSGGKKNKDLWLDYYNIAKDFTIKMVWEKGHANNPFNNRCDELATMAADKGPYLVDAGFEGENPNLLFK